MKKIILLLLVIAFSACSIFQNTEKEEKPNSNIDTTEEVYVFDEVSESENNSESINELKDEVDKTFSEENEVVENKEIIKSANTNGNSFYLQIGAFTTLNRAERFAKENDSLVPFKLSIIFNQTNSLYTVRSLAYATKEEVITIRDKFKYQNLYIDSFIVTE